MEGIRDVVGFVGDKGAAGCTYHRTNAATRSSKFGWKPITTKFTTAGGWVPACPKVQRSRSLRVRYCCFEGSGCAQSLSVGIPRWFVPWMLGSSSKDQVMSELTYEQKLKFLILRKNEIRTCQVPCKGERAAVHQHASSVALAHCCTFYSSPRLTTQVVWQFYNMCLQIGTTAMGRVYILTETEKVRISLVT